MSHIENAIWVGYKDFSMDRIEELDKNKPVLIYCSLGKRSGDIGEKLQSEGFTLVKNLYGGIFKWKNEGRQVVNDSGETDEIHVYSKSWGIWVSNGEKIY